MCVCCRELRARVKVGCFFFGRRFCTKCTKKPQKRKKKGKKKGEFLPQKREKKNKRTRLCKESRLEEDSFFLSSGRKPLRETTKEKKTHLNARRIKRREERERETGREGKRERRFIGRRRKPKRDGFGQTRRHSKAFAGGARGERDRDRGETRWVAVFETFRSFVFFSCSVGGRVAPPARVSVVFFWVCFRCGGEIFPLTPVLLLFSFGDDRKNGENQTSQRRSGG